MKSVIVKFLSFFFNSSHTDCFIGCESVFYVLPSLYLYKAVPQIMRYFITSLKFEINVIRKFAEQNETIDEMFVSLVVAIVTV